MPQAEALVREVLLLSRNTLLVNLRFLDSAFAFVEVFIMENKEGHTMYDDTEALRRELLD